MEAPLFDIDIPGTQATANKFQPGTGLAWATLPIEIHPKVRY